VIKLEKLYIISKYYKQANKRNYQLNTRSSNNLTVSLFITGSLCRSEEIPERRGSSVKAGHEKRSLQATRHSKFAWQCFNHQLILQLVAYFNFKKN